MTNRSGKRGGIRTPLAYASSLCALWAGVVLLPGAPANAQTAPKSREQLEQQVDEMQARLRTAQRDIDAYHSELLLLRQQFENLKAQVGPVPEANASGEAAADLQQAVADLKEQQAMNQAEIQVQEQAKVETASKYALKLHGLVLFNASVNNGALDQPTLPSFAIPASGDAANGSLTATGRQTLLGIDATGPSLWGARTYASIEMGFSGSAASGNYSGGQNFFRLRTAAMQIAWPETTIKAGVAPLILTPDYATSYFSIAEPAMSWSGSLWSWLPQLSVEQHIHLAADRQVALQAALADVPDAGASAGGTVGQVSAAERSRYPASEVRASYQWGGRIPGSIGAGGYWSPHAYGIYGSLDAWAATVDWKLALPASLQFTGEFYRGSALGGLSAGAYKDYVFLYPSDRPDVAESTVTGLNDLGGWAQIKYRPIDPLEFNLAFGQDNADSSQLRRADLDLTNPFAGLARNQTFFGNIVYRPKSTIVLSGEYRKIRSWQIVGPLDAASIFGIAAGYEF